MLWTLIAAAALTAAEAPDSTEPAIQRVGGNMEIEVTERPGPEGPLYSSEGVFTDTKLPVGYPRPTPPGAIELKTYPPVRQAEVSGEGGTGSGSMRGFWPLFRHISRNDIAMTAPVEMRYQDSDGDERTDRWTMAFLYHTPENGPTGEDGNVVIVDTEPVTVLSIGVMGGDRMTSVEEHLARLEAWITESPEWDLAGEVRVLGYNGPNVRPANRWWEVQVPVAPVESGQ